VPSLRLRQWLKVALACRWTVLRWPPLLWMQCAFMFTEEDRICGDARYEVSGILRVGIHLPLRFARVLKLKVDADGKVLQQDAVTPHHRAAVSGTSVLQALPPRLRWATQGPFGIGETRMACEDISIRSLAFHHPPDWPAGWFTVYANFKPPEIDSAGWLPK
jgi:hypothetical protein